MNNARTEMAAMSKFDAIIVNDDLDRAYSELREVVTRALQGTK
jgi:guanylate kinase